MTADGELLPSDPFGYRIAIIEGFRRRGIYPADAAACWLTTPSLRNPLAECKRRKGVAADDFCSLLADFSALDNEDGKISQKVSAWRVSDDRTRIAESTEDLQLVRLAVVEAGILELTAGRTRISNLSVGPPKGLRSRRWGL